MNNKTTKVIFVHTPKAAGGSIHTWLGTHNKKYNFEYATGHYTLKELRNQLPGEDFNFTVIRNTYSRMISLYVFSRAKYYRRYQKSIRSNNTEAVLKHKRELEETDKGISSWLEYAHENHPILTAPLKHWIEGIDFILNQEKLNEEFKIIQEKLNCFEPLEKKYHRMDYDPKEFYSDKFKKVVEKYYSDEIEKYKYLPKY